MPARPGSNGEHLRCRTRRTGSMLPFAVALCWLYPTVNEHTQLRRSAQHAARGRAHSERRRRNSETDQHGTEARGGVETMARAPGTPPPRRHKRCTAAGVSGGGPRLLPTARVCAGTHTASIPKTAAAMPHRPMRCCPGRTQKNPTFRNLIQSLRSFPACPIRACHGIM
jgi:hypothetical protein